jgi:hypothetical protein
VAADPLRVDEPELSPRHPREQEPVWQVATGERVQRPDRAPRPLSASLCRRRELARQPLQQLVARGTTAAQLVLEVLLVNPDHRQQQMRGAHRGPAEAAREVVGDRAHALDPAHALGRIGPGRAWLIVPLRLEGASPTPRAWRAAPTPPCMRSTRSQRSASSAREVANGIAVRARPRATDASFERAGDSGDGELMPVP